jgi:capsular exopolysaccharide synthesis family protein
MGNIFRNYIRVAKRWMWMLVVGVVLCGSATYLISTFLRPVYQASTYLIVDIGDTAHPSVTESLQAVPTFAQLLETPTVLNPVVAKHPGMSLSTLVGMLTVKSQADTQIIELDVQSPDPALAAELANQISQSFVSYVDASAGNQDLMQIVPAQVPTLPAQPRPLEDAAIGAGVGLLLTLLLAMLFEWIGNRATSVEQIQELLGWDVLNVVPRLSHGARSPAARQVIAEKAHLLGASLELARARKAFKLVLFTSALAGEGKSTVASQVAVHLAQSGKRVLLIDFNIHRPMLAQLLHVSQQPGLTDLLSKQGDLRQIASYCQKTGTPGLQVLSSGGQRMPSATLLQALTSTRLLSRLQDSAFDYILCDAPPLFAVAETQMLAPLFETLVLVVNGARTPRRMLERTRQTLQRLSGVTVLGVVVNQSSWQEYADAHPYTLALPQPQPQNALSYVIEQVTMELPAHPAGLLSAAAQDRLQPAPFPDTGEHEPVQVEEPEYVIRPSFSLSGLTLPTNGLTRRAFPERVQTGLPPSFAE